MKSTAGDSVASLPPLWSMPQASSPKRRNDAVSRQLPAQTSKQKGLEGCKVCPSRWKDQVVDGVRAAELGKACGELTEAAPKSPTGTAQGNHHSMGRLPQDEPPNSKNMQKNNCY